MLSSLPFSLLFADLLSLHLVILVMFFFNVVVMARDYRGCHLHAASLDHNLVAYIKAGLPDHPDQQNASQKKRIGNYAGLYK